jgi:hypothetical protein
MLPLPSFSFSFVALQHSEEGDVITVTFFFLF